MKHRPFDRSALAGDVLTVAPDLLGGLIVSELDGLVVARIVEVEAYRQDDPASHSYRGETPTTRPMFDAPGTAYVYFTYGMHHCMNVTCEPAGRGAALLLRAAVIIEGIDVARSRRPTAKVDRDLARGPARLAAALGVDRSHSGCDLLDASSPLRLERDGVRVPSSSVRRGPRTGVRLAAEQPWRFWIDGVAEVSPYRRHPKAPPAA